MPSAHPYRWWGMFEPTESKVPLRDRDQPVVLSGSALDQLANTCALQWFLGREVKADAPATVAQGFGNVVHVLADEVASGHTPADLDVLKSPPQAPKANAHRERIIGTLRREVLDRMLILNEHHPRRTLTRYLQHYNTARPHRGIGDNCPHRKPKPDHQPQPTWPTTESIAEPSSAASSTSTRSPADQHHREPAGQTSNPII